MNKAHSLCFYNGSLEVKNDSFHLHKNGEELHAPKVPYLSVVDAFMYLVNCTWSYIIFYIDFFCKI